MFQGLHAILRGVGKRRKRCSGLYHTKVFLRTMGHITFIGIAGRKAPAVFSIAFIFFWIVYAPSAIDQCVITVLLPVISMPIFEAMRIETHKGIMGKE